MTVTIPPGVSEALELPGAGYTLPTHTQAVRAMTVGMDHWAVTNATSRYPIVGTEAFGDCMAIIFYNRKTQTAAIWHTPYSYPEDLDGLLARVHGDGTSAVEAHIIGSAQTTEGTNVIGTITADERNAHNLRELDSLLKRLKTYPRVELKTFDVYDKRKPHAVAIDARTGNLIRGSKLFTTFEQINQDVNNMYPLRSSKTPLPKSLFGRAGYPDPVEDNFDGTLPEFQIPLEQGSVRVAPRPRGARKKS